MSMNSIIFNGATIYFDEPIDFHLIQGKLMIDSVPYNGGKTVSKKTTKVIKTKKQRAARGSIIQKLTDAGLSVKNPVTINFGDYSKKSIYGAVKRMGFKQGSIADTDKRGVYKISCI